METVSFAGKSQVLDRPAVLVIDDDPGSQRYLRRILRQMGCLVTAYPDHQAASAAMLETRHDMTLVAVDLIRYDVSGVLSQLPSGDMPVLVLALNGGADMIASVLDAGADECLAMPFRELEFVTRVRRTLSLAFRRGSSTTRVNVGNLQIDLLKPIARIGDQKLHLSRLQYKVLRLLVQHQGAVVPFRHLEQHVWGTASKSSRTALHRVVCELRSKLAGAEARPMLETASRAGYRLRYDNPICPRA